MAEKRKAKKKAQVNFFLYCVSYRTKEPLTLQTYHGAFVPEAGGSVYRGSGLEKLHKGGVMEGCGKGRRDQLL